MVSDCSPLAQPVSIFKAIAKHKTSPLFRYLIGRPRLYIRNFNVDDSMKILADDTDGSAVIIDDGFNDTEAQTHTALFLLPLANRVERLKDVCKLVGRYGISGIIEGITNASVRTLSLDGNFRLGSTVFDGIIQKIDKELAQPVWLAKDEGSFLCLANDALYSASPGTTWNQLHRAKFYPNPQALHPLRQRCAAILPAALAPCHAGVGSLQRCDSCPYRRTPDRHPLSPE